jgi:penicillin-binding protein 1C
MDALQAGGVPDAPAPPAGVQAHSLRFAGGIEPPRREWYLEDTAPGEVVSPVDARARLVRISSPVDGMVIALDPDIPADLQRVPIAAEGAGTGLTLAMNGRTLGSAGRQFLWQPTVGTHRVALADASGRIVDRLSFTVR